MDLKVTFSNANKRTNQRPKEATKTNEKKFASQDINDDDDDDDADDDDVDDEDE